MKTPLHASALAAALLSLVPASHAADRLEEWMKFLPENTIATLHVKNAPELGEDWKKSALGRFLEDEEVKKWLAPGLKEGGSALDKISKEETGMTFAENMAVYPGASLVAFALNDAETMSKQEEPPFVAFSDIAGKEEEFKAAKAKTLEAKKKKHADAELITTDLAGHEVSVIAESKEAEAKWIESWAIVDGVVLESNNKELLESTLAGMKGGGGEAAIAPKLNRLIELAEGTPDISLCVDLEPLIAMAAEALGKSAGEQMPFPPEVILAALGLDELQSIAFTMDFTDERGLMNFVILHDENPSGLMTTLMRGTSTEVPQPAFVPPGMSSASVTRQSFSNIWNALMAGVEKLGPMAAMMTAQIGMVEQQVGMTLKNDLFGTMDDTVVTMELAGTPKPGSDLPNVSTVTMIKLKDAPRFTAALEAVKKIIGNGFAVFEETEFEGHKIFAVKSSLTPAAGAGQASPQISYVITDEYVAFANGGMDLLHKVLTRMKSPEGESFWDDAAAQEALKALPKDYTGFGVTRGGTQLRTILTTFAQLQEMGAKGKGKGKGKGKSDDDADEEEEETSKMFDASATPSEEVFNKYFGTGSTGMYSLPDAIQATYISLPVATP